MRAQPKASRIVESLVPHLSPDYRFGKCYLLGKGDCYYRLFLNISRHFLLFLQQATANDGLTFQMKSGILK